MHARAAAMTVLPCNLACIPEQTNRACKHATATDGHWPLSRRSGILFMHNRLVLVSTQVATAGERLSPQRIFNFNQTKLRSRNFSRPRVSMCGYSTTVLLSTPRRLVTIGHLVAGMDTKLIGLLTYSCSPLLLLLPMRISSCFRIWLLQVEGMPA